MSASGYRLTSYEAWESMQEKLPDAQREVFNCIFYSPCPLTDKEVAAILKRPINCITPRRGELAAKGYVIEAGETVNPNGRRATLWEAAKSPFAPVLEAF